MAREKLEEQSDLGLRERGGKQASNNSKKRAGWGGDLLSSLIDTRRRGGHGQL